MKARTAALAAVAVAILARDSLADPAARAPNAAAAAASASASARVVMPPRVRAAALPAFDAEPFPEEPSRAPKADEWKPAKPVRVTRAPEGLRGCSFYRVREWVKLHCERTTAGVRMLAGSRDGVAIWVAEPTGDGAGAGAFSTGLGRFFDLVFPVRRRDHRVFESISLDFGEWEGWGTSSDLILEEEWRAGATGPTLSLVVGS